MFVGFGYGHDDGIDSGAGLADEGHLRGRDRGGGIADQHQHARLLGGLRGQFRQAGVQAADTGGVDEGHLGHGGLTQRDRRRGGQLLDAAITHHAPAGGHPVGQLPDLGRARAGGKEQLGGMGDGQITGGGDRHRHRGGDINPHRAQIAVADQGVDQGTFAALHLAGHHHGALRRPMQFRLGEVGDGVVFVGAQHFSRLSHDRRRGRIDPCLGCCGRVHADHRLVAVPPFPRPVMESMLVDAAIQRKTAGCQAPAVQAQTIVRDPGPDSFAAATSAERRVGA